MFGLVIDHVITQINIKMKEFSTFWAKKK